MVLYGFGAFICGDFCGQRDGGFGEIDPGKIREGTLDGERQEIPAINKTILTAPKKA